MFFIAKWPKSLQSFALLKHHLFVLDWRLQKLSSVAGYEILYIMMISVQVSSTQRCCLRNSKIGCHVSNRNNQHNSLRDAIKCWPIDLSRTELIFLIWRTAPAQQDSCSQSRWSRRECRRGWGRWSCRGRMLRWTSRIPGFAPGDVSSICQL